MDKDMFSYSEGEISAMVRRCYARLKSYVMHLSNLDATHADDILQESLCKFISKKAPIKASKADGYFFCIVRNECINSQTRHHKTVSLDSMEAEAAWNFLAEVDFENAKVKNEEHVGISQILDFADTFSPRTKDIFYQSRMEGKTHEEIAKDMGISTRAVEKHLKKTVDEYRREFRKIS